MAKNDILGYGYQTIEQDDIEAVTQALKKDFLTTGPNVKAFEESFAKKVGAKYAIAVANGTAALHLACLAAGFSAEDEVIVSPLTFAADVNAVLYCDATPIFADVTTTYGHINAEEIKKKITAKTKGIIPVDYAGFPCDMAAIASIAKEHDLIVIQDGCHALGASYKDGKGIVGDCRYADMTIFSFHPVKHITTGEGGMITTNNENLAATLYQLRNHGLHQPEEKRQNWGPWYQEIKVLGFNYRLTDIQCALGSSQLKKLERFVERRRELARQYDKAFANINRVEPLPPSQQGSYHLYIIKVANKETRRRLFDHLWEQGIHCQVHYVPIHLQAYYAKQGWKKGDFPVAEAFYERILSIPLYPLLTDKDQERVINEIRGFFEV